jgi:hypothetical protein
MIANELHPELEVREELTRWEQLPCGLIGNESNTFRQLSMN